MPNLYRVICFLCVVVSMWSTCSATTNSAFGTDFIFAPVNTAHDVTSNISLIFNNREGFNFANIDSGLVRFNSIYFGSSLDYYVYYISTYSPVKIPYVQGVSNLGTRIKTTYPLSLFVTVSDNKRQLGEGTLVFPVETLGKRYFVNSLSSNSAFTVVSSVRSTFVTLTFRNKTVSKFGLAEALQTVSFSGPDLDGTLIEASSPVAVFVGRDAVDHPSDPTNYLWEQAVPQEKFGKEFVLVNPAAGQHHDPTSTTIRLLNGDDKDVLVDISGLTSTPILLVPGQAIAIETTNLTNKINSTGLIDVQIISGSPAIGNRTQWGLIPNTQFVDQAHFFVNNYATNLLALVALTSDVTNSTSSLTFNGVSINLADFEISADPNYSYLIMTPVTGSNLMKANFNLAGYLFSDYVKDGSYGSFFGTIIGRDLSKN